MINLHLFELKISCRQARLSHLSFEKIINVGFSPMIQYLIHFNGIQIYLNPSAPNAIQMLGTIFGSLNGALELNNILEKERL